MSDYVVVNKKEITAYRATIVILVAILGLSIWAIDINADRINELEAINADITKEVFETRKDIESCAIENSLLNDRVD